MKKPVVVLIAGLAVALSLVAYRSGVAQDLVPVEGEPPALAPYAPDDPIPKLVLQPHTYQASPRQAVETFLAYLSDGLNISPTLLGSTIPGRPDGYERAWELMVGDRPSLAQFKAQWTGTVRLGVIQLEAMDDTRFFAELQRVEYVKDHWATSLYSARISTTKTAEGWRIQGFEPLAENFVEINLGGHQAWLHDVEAVTKVLAGAVVDVTSISYERRVATIQMKDASTGKSKTMRLARLVEGTWVLLSKK